MFGPDKNKLYPNENIKTVCYIRNLPKRPNVEIGEYTYYSDNNKSPERFYDNIEHHYEFLEITHYRQVLCNCRRGYVYHEWSKPQNEWNYNLPPL